VFHDPFVWPYMAAPITKLALIGCQHDSTPSIADNGVFMPITPSLVRMPLHWERLENASGDLELRAGLFDISKTLHVLLHNSMRPDAFATGHRSPFFLSPRALNAQDMDGINPEYQELLASELAKCIRKLHVSKDWKAPRWFWYELHTNSIWIWDAELPPKREMPETIRECMQYLLGIVRLDIIDGKASARSVLITVEN
jgi:hypothetical protein